MCRSGCATKDHASYAECCRESAPRVLMANESGKHDYTTQKRWNKELSDYRAAVAQGVEPDGTDRKSIDKAMALSDRMGKPYDSHKPLGGFAE